MTLFIRSMYIFATFWHYTDTLAYTHIHAKQQNTTKAKSYLHTTQYNHNHHHEYEQDRYVCVLVWCFINVFVNTPTYFLI